MQSETYAPMKTGKLLEPASRLSLQSPQHGLALSKKRFVTAGSLVAALSAVFVVALDTRTVEAHSGHKCRKNYYHCTLNAGGSIDPSNPDCCWSPVAGPGNRNMQKCPSGYYKCDFNKDGRIDSSKPGCCLSDIRVKREIRKLGTLANGLGVYFFKYLWSDQGYVGVMAQEAQKMIPDAVVQGTDGYLRVNYDKVGMPFQTWEAWQGVTAQ